MALAFWEFINIALQQPYFITPPSLLSNNVQEKPSSVTNAHLMPKMHILVNSMHAPNAVSCVYL
jgi:hypothetical protein